MRHLLHSCDVIYTCDAQDRVLRDGWLLVEDGRVAALGEGAPPAGDFDTEEDMSGLIAMPGFVNLHHHYFQTLTRAVPGALRGHLLDWLTRMYPVWAGITPDDMAVATRASIAQLALTGATSSVDHAYLLPPVEGDHIAAEIDASRDMGFRTYVFCGALTQLEGDLEIRLAAMLGPNAGGLLLGLEEAERHVRDAITAHQDTSEGALIKVGIGPTTTTFETPGHMRAMADLARELDTGLHVHFHPRPDERANCAGIGTTPLDFLQDCGWLGPRTLLAHSTRLSPEEMRRCADAGVGIAHCARMILRLGARVTPVHEMLEAGLRLGIGVDGGASNDSGSMLGELRLAYLLHRVAGGEGAVPWESWLSPYRLLTLATRDSADCLGWSKIGRLATGCRADLTAFRLSGVAYAGAPRDPLATLLLTGDNDRAALTMTDGRVLVRDGALLDQDEAALQHATDAATNRLIERAQCISGIDYDRF